MSKSIIFSIAGDPGKFADLMQQIRVNTAQPTLLAGNINYEGVAGEVRSGQIDGAVMAYRGESLSPPLTQLASKKDISRV